MTWRMFFFVFVPGIFIAYVLGYLAGVNVATSHAYLKHIGQALTEVSRTRRGEDAQ